MLLRSYVKTWCFSISWGFLKMYRLRRGRALEVLLVLLAALGFVLAFSYRILLNFSGLGLSITIGTRRWRCTGSSFYSVAHFHQFPFWDPYKCGGMPLIGNPSSRVLTPFFLLHLIRGPLIGIHLEIVAHLAIGFAGAHLLARGARVGKLGANCCWRARFPAVLGTFCISHLAIVPSCRSPISPTSFRCCIWAFSVDV